MESDTSHVDSSIRCLVWHKGGISCIHCEKCHRFILPENMDEVCEGPRDPSQIIVYGIK